MPDEDYVQFMDRRELKRAWAREEQLQKDLAEARKSLNEMTSLMVSGEDLRDQYKLRFILLEGEVASLRAERAKDAQRWKDLVDKYHLSHLPGCSRGLPSADRPCNCGFFDLLGPLSDRETKKREEQPELGPFPNPELRPWTVED